MTGLDAAQKQYDDMSDERMGATEILEKNAERINQMIADLMATGAKYDPLEAGNLAEAMMNEGKEWFADLGELLRFGQDLIAAEKIAKASDAYWRDLAKCIVEEKILQDDQS